MSVRSLVAFALAALLAPAASAQLRADRDSSDNKLLTPFKPVVAKANGSTVQVRCDDRDTVLGTVVSANGHVLTKASELRGKVITCRFGNGEEYTATIVGSHKKTDLALLKLNAEGFKPITFSDSKAEPVGNWLAAAGPKGDPVAVGIVSVATRDMPSRSLFDDDDHIPNGNRGYLGVSIDRTYKATGAKITDLTKSGAADKAGLQVDDVIVRVNGKDVKDFTALVDLLEGFRPGDEVVVKAKRGDEDVTAKATLTGNPQPTREEIQNSMGGVLSGRRTGFPSVLQTDMVVTPEECGGPVVDLDGKVLGVVIARAGRVNTWVLPSETVRPLVTEMMSGKYPPLTVKK